MMRRLKRLGIALLGVLAGFLAGSVLLVKPAGAQTFQQVIDDINSKITTNGQQAITGAILNGVLIEMMTYTQGVAFGGCVGGQLLSAASTNATIIKGGPGTLCAITWLNTTNTLMDIRLYDTPSTPNCGSASGLVANFVAQGNTINPGATIVLGGAGLVFATGIGMCVTGGNANNDTTPAVTGLNINYSFR